MAEISEFFGEHRFLSNFYSCSVTFEGLVYPSAEHAYQAAKTASPEARALIQRASSPGQAKRNGRLVSLRTDWEQVKKPVMLSVVLAKFTQNYALAEMLRATAGHRLTEGNTWHDQFWGNCTCGSNWSCEQPGLNVLGKLLEVVRFTVS